MDAREHLYQTSLIKSGFVKQMLELTAAVA